MPVAADTELLRELKEQTRWLRLIGLTTLRTTLTTVLTTDKQKAAYEYSNGERGTRDIAKLAGVGVGTVSDWWQQWIAIGICTESPKRAGRGMHLASLSSLGIELPKSVTTVAAAGSDSEPSTTGE